jgi:hypothetical protein
LLASGRGDAASVVRHFRNVSFRESSAGVNLQNVPFAGNSLALTAFKVKARLADLGGTVFVLSPADLGKFIAEDTEKWAKVLRDANI